MKKIHLFLANTLLVTHILLAIFILIGWVFPNIALYYRLTLFLWFGSWVFLGYCPLTKWELLLRKKSDPDIDINTEIIQLYTKKFFKKNISSNAILLGGLVVFSILVILTFTVSGKV